NVKAGLFTFENEIISYGLGVCATVNVKDVVTSAEIANDRIAFTNCEIILPEGITMNEVLAGDSNADDENKFLSNAHAVGSKGDVGANMDVFSWTFAATKGAIPTATLGTTISKSGSITADETWTPENIYVLEGKVVVSEGVTLTIEPG